MERHGKYPALTESPSRGRPAANCCWQVTSAFLLSHKQSQANPEISRHEEMSLETHCPCLGCLRTKQGNASGGRLLLVAKHNRMPMKDTPRRMHNFRPFQPPGIHERQATIPSSQSSTHRFPLGAIVSWSFEKLLNSLYTR